MPASQHLAGDVELISPILPVTRLVDKTGVAIAQGDVVHMIEATDNYETVPIGATGLAPFGVAAKAALSTDVKVEIWEGPDVYVYVKADSAIPPNNLVRNGTVTAGRVSAFVQGTTAANLLVGQYIAKGNVSPLQGDGVTAITAAANNDLILVRLY
jgi:hypothetical protein